jgi:hypothetical protein
MALSLFANTNMDMHDDVLFEQVLRLRRNDEITMEIV